MLLIGGVVAIVLVFGGPMGFKTNERAATASLTSANYTSIEITGYRWFGCGRSFWFSSGYTAQHASGKTETGVVCGGSDNPRLNFIRPDV